MNRKAFTLVELLIVIAIIGLLAALLFGRMGCWEAGSTPISFQGKVLRKWERNEAKQATVMMVDVQKSNGEIVVLTNHDDIFEGKHNSITLHATLTPNQFYTFKVKGELNETWGRYPNIISATLAQ